MDLGISAKVAPLLADVRRFMNEEIAPLEHEYLSEIAVGDRWQFTDRQIEIMEGLKAKAKAKGLWNFFL
ncbi:MAG: acyl-CoA dehydrogenase, partial [Halieaceae bacterium]|nr:acyl-CoA dehydrogenase [Halieaceae bacterium]